jgi:hypothetical protein
MHHIVPPECGIIFRSFLLPAAQARAEGAQPLPRLFMPLNCWKYALEPTGFDPLVDSDGFDPLWCKSPNGPQML